MSGARFGWIVLFAAVGCGSSGASSSAAGGSDGAALSPGEAVTSIGPIPLAAAASRRRLCITKRLGNDEDLVISSITATLAPGSHHLIVYRSKDTEENLTPTPCMPFTGLVAEEAEPIALIGLREFSWTFPSGVAIELPAHPILPGSRRTTSTPEPPRYRGKET